MLRCPAKINLFLAIQPRDSKGFHPLDTVFCRMETLNDTLELRKTPGKAAHLICEVDKLWQADGALQEAARQWTNSPTAAEENLVMRALRSLERHTGKKMEVELRLTKGIPLQAGLGGGASDAAATLLELNRLENLSLSADELMNLGRELGKDVPFFISGYSVAHGTGYGDQISPLPNLPKNLHIELWARGPSVSTPEAFADWDRLGLSGRVAPAAPKVVDHDNAPAPAPSSASLRAALLAQDTSAILAALHNDFEHLPYAQKILKEALTTHEKKHSSAALNAASRRPDINGVSPNLRFLLAGSGGAVVKISIP